MQKNLQNHKEKIKKPGGMFRCPFSSEVTRKRVSPSSISSTLHSAGPSLSATLLQIDVARERGIFSLSRVAGLSGATGVGLSSITDFN